MRELRLSPDVLKLRPDPQRQPREGCMCEAQHLRMFGPWNALQQLVAGPAIERI